MCDGYYDLGELLRYCGFKKPLKDVFFPKMHSTSIKCMPEQPVNIQQINLIKQSYKIILSTS